MKIYILTDMEGVGGVISWSQVSGGDPQWHEARIWLTEEVNAAAEGALEAGATEILVKNQHGAGRTPNIAWERLNPRVHLITGYCGGKDYPGLDEKTDGVFMLGCHAMARTENAVLCHTECFDFRGFYINGRECGEMVIDGSVAGERGVPVILITGDDKACAQAKDWFGNIETVAVKKSLGYTAAQMLPHEERLERIRTSAEKAVRRLDEIAPLVHDSPMTLRLEIFTDKPDGFPAPDIPYRTVELTGDRFLETYVKVVEG